MSRFVKWSILVVEVLLIVSLIKGLWQTVRSRQRIDDLRQREAELRLEQEELITKRGYVESEYYIESVARDTLNLSKPGEMILLVDEEAIKGIPGAEDKQVEEKPVWRKWVEVFFGGVRGE